MDARLVRRPAALAIALLAGAALLGATACGPTGSNAPGKPRTSAFPQAERYAACMRAHGYPSFPDPTAAKPTSGGPLSGSPPSQGLGMYLDGAFFPLAGVDTNSQQFHRADQACSALLGTTSGPPASSSSNAQMKQGALTFSACMRHHGLPTFPDPLFGTPPSRATPLPSGVATILGINMPGLSYYFEMPQGLDMHSQQYQSAYKACQADLRLPQAP